MLLIQTKRRKLNKPKSPIKKTPIIEQCNYNGSLFYSIMINLEPDMT